VLLELCDRINDKSKEDVCWQKQETIAERTGFTERTVNTALKELQARGLIKRQRRMIGGQRTSDMITVLIDGPQAGSSTAAPPSDSDPRPASPDVLLPEANSGGNPNDVPVPTGNTFSVIYKDKSTRLNQISPNFLYEFPEPSMVASGSPTMIAGSLSSCTAGFLQSCRSSQSSGPRRWRVGTGPAFAATGVGRRAHWEGDRGSTRSCAY
jgi:DNA-binding transcriptional MocR family regulator